MADKLYKITFELGDGTEKSIEFASPQGPQGDTPIRGVDYWTAADQEAIVQQVIAALGTPVFGRVDADNNIILTGELADGTYTLKYEDVEGNVTEIGTLEQGTSYTNLADPTSADWLTNKRLNSSGVVTDTTPSLTTNYIPVKMGDTVRIRYMNIYHQGPATGNATTHFYDANKNRIASVTPASVSVYHIIADADGLGATFNMTEASEKFTIVSGSVNDIRYARFVGKLYDGYAAEDIIITVNEEITEEEPTYTNALTLAVDSDGTPYNGGQGWKDGYRLNSSGAETQREGMQVSGFIPAKYGDILRMRNITFNYKAENASYRDNYYIAFYDSSFAFLGYRKPNTEGTVTENYDIVLNDQNQNNIGLGTYNGSNAVNLAYIRISSSEISNDSIVTINQEITE